MNCAKMRNQTEITISFKLTIVLFLILIVAGCAVDSTGKRRNSQINFLDGSASMRVEVEVYKGPLSKELTIQISELNALVTDAERALEILHANMTVSALRLGCVTASRICEVSDENGGSCEKIKNQPNRAVGVGVKDIENNIELLYDSPTNLQLPQHLENYKISVPRKDIPEKDRYIFCNTLGQILIDTSELNKDLLKLSNKQLQGECEVKLVEDECQIENIETPCEVSKPTMLSVKNVDSCLKALSEYSLLGARLEQRALYWSSENVATMPESIRLRIEMAHFAQFAKEYGSNIIARSDALIKQIAGGSGDPIDRKQLPNSVFLRDSSPTAYLNLYQWNKASVDREIASAEDRTRMVEQLVADTYWSKVNTVFAAGQGDVSMALIKDDIGNWQLKSFDNSPGELLEAYRDLGLAAVRSVEKSISNGNLSIANNEFSSANNLALGSPKGIPTHQSTNELSIFRIETARQIIEIGNEFEKQKSELEKQISELKIQIGDESDGLTKIFLNSKNVYEKEKEQELGIYVENKRAGIVDKFRASESNLAMIGTSIEQFTELKESVSSADPISEGGQLSLQSIDKEIERLRIELEKELRIWKELKNQLDIYHAQKDKVAEANDRYRIEELRLNTAKKALDNKEDSLEKLVKDSIHQIQQRLELLNSALTALVATDISDNITFNSSSSD